MAEKRREDQASEQRVRVRHLVTSAVWGVALVLLVLYFDAITTLLLGVLAAGAMASALYPLTQYVPGPRWLRAIIVGLLPPLLLAGLITLVSTTMAGYVQEQIQQWPESQKQMDALLSRWSEHFGLEQPITTKVATMQAMKILTGGESQVFSATAETATGLLIALAFVFFGSIYFLAEPPGRLLTPIQRALPGQRGEQLCASFTSVVPKLRWWLIGTLISMTTVGLISVAGYLIVGLNMAIPLALLTGFAEIVPTLGPLTALIVAMLVALTQSPGTVLGVLIVYSVVQLAESYLLLPLVMKKTTEIPPVVTLFTVVFWGQLLGAPGLLLAIPLDLTIWSLLDHLVLQPERSAGIETASV